MARKSSIKNLKKARKAKNDEFYTQYIDIQKEIEKYLDYNSDTFRSKAVYCNCDDPFESNFFRYFVLNFNKLGLKQLITTSYKPSPVANTQLGLFGDDKTLTKSKSLPAGRQGRAKITANKFIINEVRDIDNDGEFNLEDIAKQLKVNKNNEWAPLEGDGDFRSDECVELLKQSDIVVTNPPFSLFREYFRQLFDYKKKFLIIGNINCLTYREIFQKIKENIAWLGNGMGRWISGFIVPESYDLYGSEARIDKNGNRIVATNNCLWLTNLDHGRRHQPLPLMTMEENLKYSKHKEIKGKKAYDKYDNYDAIEIPFTDAIPSDYKGVMGVPVTFLDKYNPKQFEILGNSNVRGEREHLMNKVKSATDCTYINGKPQYARILIKHKKK
ncbi:MAG: adenine-specific methyltransferase EcoRI family protein [Patescibacteria group bacterium]|nr:adenine-specific methyltransferase EcoRI family protein [Patescibacteria group bacterium]MDD5164327.1 adenine-specific methyltransferase EcoRI family protein [Patescibacteria group bacterium]MDD5534773.1 adenine-specific methyltransferase EcoRI family protein [Patescibacteria group bacterium]